MQEAQEVIYVREGYGTLEGKPFVLPPLILLTIIAWGVVRRRRRNRDR